MLVDGGLAHAHALRNFAEGQSFGKMQHYDFTTYGREQLCDAHMQGLFLDVVKLIGKAGKILEIPNEVQGEFNVKLV